MKVLEEGWKAEFDVHSGIGVKNRYMEENIFVHTYTLYIRTFWVF